MDPYKQRAARVLQCVDGAFFDAGRTDDPERRVLLAVERSLVQRGRFVRRRVVRDLRRELAERRDLDRATRTLLESKGPGKVRGPHPHPPLSDRPLIRSLPLALRYARRRDRLVRHVHQVVSLTHPGRLQGEFCLIASLRVAAWVRGMKRPALRRWGAEALGTSRGRRTWGSVWVPREGEGLPPIWRGLARVLAQHEDPYPTRTEPPPYLGILGRAWGRIARARPSRGGTHRSPRSRQLRWLAHRLVEAGSGPDGSRGYGSPMQHT